MFHCHWITSEQEEYGIRFLTGIANRLAGIPSGFRNKATSKQLIKLGIIEMSYLKTFSKKLRRYFATKKEFPIRKLIESCEEKQHLLLTGLVIKPIKFSLLQRGIKRR